jgi:hypothetical protein
VSTRERLKDLIDHYGQQLQEQKRLSAPEIGELAQSVIDAQHEYIKELEGQLAETRGALLTLRALGVT